MSSRETHATGSEPALSLEQVLGVLRRRWWLIALCCLLAAGSAFAFSKQQRPRYTATASLLFTTNQLGQQVAGLQAVSGGDPQVQQGTNIRLVTLGRTAATTAGRIGGGLTQEDIRESVSVAGEGNTNIVNVAATSTSPRQAARIANTYCEEFVRGQQEAIRSYFTSALAHVDKQLEDLTPQERDGPTGTELQNRAESLRTLSEFPPTPVQIAGPADVPTAPSSPRMARNTVVGGIFGLLLGLGLAFLRERLDRRVKDPDDLARIFGFPLLATVPESGAYRRHSALGEPHALPAPEAEVFKMLRARLRYFNINRDLRLVLVVSAAPGDGKTTVVHNLAEAAASAGSRVLIVEADLRRPTMADRRSWLRGSPGLAEVLISAAEIGDAIQTTPLASGVNGMTRGGGTVSVLPAGAIPPNPAELIESQAMEGIMEWASSHYDLVLIDTPPLSVVPDAIPLVGRIDGVVIVNRLGKHTRDGAERLREELTRLGAPVLGVVANGVTARDVPAYGYGAYGTYAAGDAKRSKAGAPADLRDDEVVDARRR